MGDMVVCADYYNVKPTIIINIIHVLEYLWNAAWCSHEEGSREAEKWVSDLFLQVLRGRAVAIAAGIRRSATNRHLKGPRRAAADTCAA